jgi:flagellin
MGIVVNTNVSSTLVQRSLGSATGEIGKSLEKLSTGFKINRASDDAAGLVISQSLQSQARGASQASSNAQTGVNLLQTAEADLGIIQENLQRIRDLTIQAANGTYGTTERNAIYSEVEARTQEIDRIAKSSAFNTIKLLDGSNTSLSLQIGSNSASSLNALAIGAPLGKATSSTLGLGDAASVSTAFGTPAKAASFLSNIDTAITTVSTRRSQIGSLQNRIDSAIKSLSIKQENMLASDSRIRDTDVAKEAANLTKNQILQQASASLLAQANQQPQIALSLLR